MLLETMRPSPLSAKTCCQAAWVVPAEIRLEKRSTTRRTSARSDHATSHPTNSTTRATTNLGSTWKKLSLMEPRTASISAAGLGSIGHLQLLFLPYHH